MATEFADFVFPFRLDCCFQPTLRLRLTGDCAVAHKPWCFLFTNYLPKPWWPALLNLMHVAPACILLRRLRSQKAVQYIAKFLAGLMPAKAKQKAMPRAAVSDVTPAAMAPGEQEVGHEEGHGDDAAPLAKPKRNRKPDKRKGSRRKKQLPGSSVCLPPGHRAKPNSGKHVTDKKRASGRHKRGTRGENAWTRLSSKVTDGCKPGPDWAAEVT
jgi:hypothetical protein